MLLLVLFMCLGLALIVQSLCMATVCAERALVDEAAGRQRLEEKDRGLAYLRQRALTAWEPTQWIEVGEAAARVQGRLSEPPDAPGWVMGAVVRQDPSVSRLATSALLEKGRDGLDLPLASLVACAVTAAEQREIPWLESDPTAQQGGAASPATAETVACVLSLPTDAGIGGGCALRTLAQPWTLDPVWQELTKNDATWAVAPGPGVALLCGRLGQVEKIPPEIGPTSVDTPALVVLTGSANLDARDWGDFYGVLVVDDGSVQLDGTTVHGAVFVGRNVAFGATGRIVFSREILRWATERSLTRVRLVPGSRWEGAE